jgi:hypothetical protein
MTNPVPPLTPAEDALIRTALEAGVGGYDTPALAAYCLREAKRALWARRVAEEIVRRNAEEDPLG